MPKKISILFLLLPLAGSSQLIIEHLYETSKSYNPWFGKESGALSVSLEMSYREGGDTTMYVAVAINQNKLRLSGTTSGSGLSSSSGIFGAIAAGVAVSKSYTLQNAQGVAVFDAVSYDSLYDVVNKLRKYAKEGIPYSKSLLFKVNKIVLGLDMQFEIDRTGERPRTVAKNIYYIQIDEASYRLSESEFNELADKTFIPLRKSFQAFNTKREILPPDKE